MSDLSRRKLLCGLGALIAAPTVVRAASLMPVRGIVMSLRRDVYLGLGGQGFIVMQVSDIQEAYNEARNQALRLLCPVSVYDGPMVRLTFPPMGYASLA